MNTSSTESDKFLNQAMMAPLPAGIEDTPEVRQRLAEALGAPEGSPPAFSGTFVVGNTHHIGLSPVCFHEGEFYPLSNYSSFTVVWEGIQFNTLEHAYQYQKFDPKGYPPLSAEQARQLRIIRKGIQLANSAHSAHETASEFTDFRRPDWKQVKVSIMEALLLAKVSQHVYVRDKLLETQGRALVENSPQDSFWGWGADQHGANMMGVLWSKIRAQLLAGAGD